MTTPLFLSSFYCPANCKASGILCPTCEIFILKNEKRLLQEQIQFLTQAQSEELLIPYYAEQLIEKYIIIYLKYQLCSTTIPDIPLSYLSNTYFITITFDPTRFGVANPPEQEEQYILYQLARIIKKGFCFSFFGCFEKHKNGITHSHLIMHSNYRVEVYDLLKRAFTNNPRNRVAIDIGNAHQTKSISYIIKESNKYFKYNNTIGT